MRNHENTAKALRCCRLTSARGCAECPFGLNNNEKCAHLLNDAADAIEELLTVCKEIAAFVIHYADEDNVSAEVLCRKLHKIGVVEKDGAWWTLPEPPKEVE